MNVEPAQRIISVRAYVQCTHGYGGSVMGVIVEPLARRLTHIVVQDYTVPAVDHLAPVEWVTGTTENLVRLGCTREILAGLEPFAEQRYIRSNTSSYHGCFRFT